jgi:hypothetical protein
MDALKLDGNAAAGLLREVFTMEVTAAVGVCGACGTSGAVGASVVYAYAPGTVFRCPTCDAVLMKIVTDGSRYWIDLSGLRTLELGQ